jgi:hypothetical protein
MILGFDEFSHIIFKSKSDTLNKVLHLLLFLLRAQHCVKYFIYLNKYNLQLNFHLRKQMKIYREI